MNTGEQTKKELILYRALVKRANSNGTFYSSREFIEDVILETNVSTATYFRYINRLIEGDKIRRKTRGLFQIVSV